MKNNSRLIRFFKQIDIQLMVWPGILLIAIFSYLPMYGIVMAFQDYDLFKGFADSPWVGFKHFEAWFTDYRFAIILRNTLAISGLKLVLGFPAPILLAILINEVKNRKFQRTIQTITYLPHFLSWVVVAGIVNSFLSADNGALNHILESSGIIREGGADKKLDCQSLGPCQQSMVKDATAKG